IEDLGELSHDQVLALLERASAFVRPTFADGDAISVREALLLGTPTVATDVSPRPPGTIVCRTGDAADLAEKVSMAISGPRRVFRSADAAEVMQSIYRSVSAARRGEASRELEGRV